MAQSRSTKFTRVKLPKTKQDAYDRMHQDMVYANRNHLIGTFLREDLPLEWHLLEVDHPVHEKKEKVTLYLDRSVTRVNLVLRDWAMRGLLCEAPWHGGVKAG